MLEPPPPQSMCGHSDEVDFHKPKKSPVENCNIHRTT